MSILVGYQSSSKRFIRDDSDGDKFDVWSPLYHNRTTSNFRSRSTPHPRDDCAECTNQSSSPLSPVQKFGRMVLLHFAAELWSYHASIRLGLLVLLLALLWQIILFTYVLFTSICIIPHIILSTFMLAFIYILQIDKKIISQRSKRAALLSHKIRNTAFLCFENLGEMGLRRVTFVIFLAPILLEMWALTFLARLLSENGFARNNDEGGVIPRCSVCVRFLLLEMVLLVPIYFHICINNDNNFNTTSTRQNESDLKGSTVNGKGEIQPILKIGTITITKKNTTTLSKCQVHVLVYLYLSAFLATIFLIEYSQIHRSILLARLFFFASSTFLILFLSQRSDDGRIVLLEIVQSAIRFALIDALEHVGEDAAEDEMLKLAMLQRIVDYWAYLLSTPSDHNNSTNANNRAQQYEMSEVIGISWYALASMLSITTTQIRNEVHHALSGKNGCQNQHSSICDLESMLSSLDVSKRAESTIMAYRTVIEECPPSRKMAIILASMCRCPALLSIFYLYMSGSIYQIHVTIALSPLLLLELIRMKKWSTSCQYAMRVRLQTEDHNYHDYTFGLIPTEMEPMDILLSRDDYSPGNRGSALQVWVNLKDSITALQLGLMSVETAQLEKKIALDVIPLGKFTYKISQKEIPHSLMTLALDVWHVYTKISSSRFSQLCGTGERQNQLSCDMVSNVQIIARRIQKVQANAFPPIPPIMNGIKLVREYQWLSHQDKYWTSITAAIGIYKDVNYNDVGVNTKEYYSKVDDAQEKCNRREINKRIYTHEYVGTCNEVVLLNDYPHSEKNRCTGKNMEHVKIEDNSTNENDTLILSKTLPDKKNREQAEVFEEVNVEIDKSNKDSDGKYISIEHVKKEPQQDAENRRITSRMVDFEDKEPSDSSYKLLDQNKESVGAFTNMLVDYASVESQSTRYFGEISIDGKKEDKKFTYRNIIKEIEVDSPSDNSEKSEPILLLDHIEDDLSLISDDGSWTEVEHTDLGIISHQISLEVYTPDRNVFPNKIDVQNKKAINKKYTNNSKFKMISARISALRTVAGSIATAKFRNRKEKNVSILEN